MFDIVVTRKDMNDIADYIEHKGLVAHMNDAGLTMGAMALILTAITNECNRILDEMNKEEENVC